MRTDVFAPALVGLLPADAVRVGDRWSAAEVAVQELTDLEKIEEGKLECRLEHGGHRRRSMSVMPMKITAASGGRGPRSGGI